MLNCSPDEVKDKLKQYQDFIKEKLGEEYVADDQQMTLLLIKSLEVRLMDMYVIRST